MSVVSGTLQQAELAGVLLVLGLNSTHAESGWLHLRRCFPSPPDDTWGL